MIIFHLFHYLPLQEKQYNERINALNQSYASSLGEMKALLGSQRKLGEQWRREMAALTQTFEAKMRHLTVENRQLWITSIWKQIRQRPSHRFFYIKALLIFHQIRHTVATVSFIVLGLYFCHFSTEMAGISLPSTFFKRYLDILNFSFLSLVLSKLWNF